ncbi:MAG: tripartite tricarboxylate transporter permease [Rhodobacteraceae bacterium]|nr:tripartite tricarboxylate transporter permease [Paracoccaceae bacterium]
MDFILLGLQQLTDPTVFMTMCIGAILGVIVGAIPGAGAAVTISILLPTTFSMDPLTGMTLLLGVYCGSAYGSAIPAVMINTPGSPVAVLTALEAKPFVDRGEARRAMSLAYSSSFVGGVLAVLALMLLTKPLAEVAKNFGSAEFAMLAFAALVLVIIGHGGRRVEATAALAFGLFLATVGIETAYSTQRYSFGQSWLIQGIPLVPMVIGLFAMSEALIQLTGRDTTRQTVQLNGHFFAGFFEIFRYKVTLFGSSIFGIICGIMPGVGEFLAQQVNYVWARKLSKEGHLFGKGAPEGIIVSEATNNAVPPAALIPMLALGIPGEELTAMMLAVFLVHNVIPGPDLFLNRPEFVAGLYWTLLAMNIVIILFLLVATNTIARAALINKRFLGVAILTLSLIGTYASNYNFSDVGLAMGFAVLGYILRSHRWPLTPILLGVVMGPILENRFRQAVGGAAGDMSIFVTRPISAIMLAGLCLLLFFTIRGALKARRPREDWQINDT